MDDLFKKLNTLIKASINDLIGDDVTARRRALEPARLGKGIDSEITALRQRINEAIAYEDELQARVQDLLREVARWDQQADDAVSAARDADARYAIEQVQRAQQRLAMAESDLREHQIVTQELIQRVNTLEAVVADARQAEAPSEESVPEPEADLGQALSDVLRDAREKITRVGEMITAKKEELAEPVAESLEEKEIVDEVAVDDDLERRRQRLSKP